MDNSSSACRCCCRLSKQSIDIPLVTTRPISYLHQTSSVLRRLPLELLSVTWNNLLQLVIDIKCTRYKNAFNKRFLRIVCQNGSAKIYSEKFLTVCNAVYFRLCIDLMHILPPVTA